MKWSTSFANTSNWSSTCRRYRGPRASFSSRLSDRSDCLKMASEAAVVAGVGRPMRSSSPGSASARHSSSRHSHRRRRSSPSARRIRRANCERGRVMFYSPWYLLLLLLAAGRRPGGFGRRSRDVAVPFSSTQFASGLPSTWRQRLAWLPAALTLARGRGHDRRTGPAARRARANDSSIPRASPSRWSSTCRAACGARFQDRWGARRSADGDQERRRAIH